MPLHTHQLYSCQDSALLLLQTKQCGSMPLPTSRSRGLSVTKISQGLWRARAKAGISRWERVSSVTQPLWNGFISPPGKPGSTEHSSTCLCLAKAPAELCLVSQVKRDLVRMCKHELSHGDYEVPHLRGGVLLTKERTLEKQGATF